MTLEDYLSSIGEEADGQYYCDGCGTGHPSFALKHSNGRNGTCATCVIDSTREPSVEPGTTEPEWDDVRAYRNILLTRTDWTQLPDVGENTAFTYAAHRTALRDVTATHSTPAEAMEWLSSVETFEP